MARQKLIRRSILQSYQNVFDAPTEMKGEWNTHFENDGPIIIELGCGKGHFAVQMAQTHAFSNLIGYDKKSDRIYIGATTALDEEIHNIAFVRALADNITQYFGPQEVDEIWITFPDPCPKKNKANKRLTHPRFLALYEQVLKPGGIIHLKTDYEPLIDYTLEVLNDPKTNFTLKELIKDIYSHPEIDETLKLQTDFEQKHLAKGKKIHYISFLLN